MARLRFTTVFSTAAALLLGSLACAHPTPEADPSAAGGSAVPPAISVSLDQESAARFFETFKLTTAGFIEWLALKNGEWAKPAGAGHGARGGPIRGLVLSSRFVGKEEKADPKSAEQIKAAAAKAEIALLRLTIDLDKDRPSLASSDPQKRQDAVLQHLDLVKLAARLGCEQVSLPLVTSGYYAEQRDAASEGVRALLDAMHSQGLNVHLLLRNGSGFSSSGEWLGEVVDAIRSSRKDARIGVLLDVSRLEYSPNAAFRELTAPTPKTKRAAPKLPAQATSAAETATAKPSSESAGAATGGRKDAAATSELAAKQPDPNAAGDRKALKPEETKVGDVAPTQGRRRNRGEARDVKAGRQRRHRRKTCEAV